MNWDEEKEMQRNELYGHGLGDKEIGALSVPVTSASSVCQWRKNRGLSSNQKQPGRDFTEEENQIIFDLYKQRLNDAKIGEKVGRHRTSIRVWRIRRGLPANAIRGGQPGQKSGYKIVRKAGKEQAAEKPGEKPRRTETAKERKESARKLVEEAERAVVDSLPTKDEILKMVKDSPDHKVTTKQLIKQGYGDVGSKRRDTISKLRELVDKDKKLVLDTSGEEIIWIWTA